MAAGDHAVRGNITRVLANVCGTSDKGLFWVKKENGDLAKLR